MSLTRASLISFINPLFKNKGSGKEMCARKDKLQPKPKCQKKDILIYEYIQTPLNLTSLHRCSLHLVSVNVLLLTAVNGFHNEAVC